MRKVKIQIDEQIYAGSGVEIMEQLRRELEEAGIEEVLSKLNQLLQ